MIVFDDTKEKDKLSLYDCGIDFTKGEAVKRDKEAEVIPFEAKEPLRSELEHFLECLQTRKSPKTDASEALAVLRVLHCAQQSLEKGAEAQPAKPQAAAKEYFVHPTAIVDEGAEIGKGSKIWHFSHISGGAKIGERCNLGQNVYVAKGVNIGNNVKIQNNVSVYEGVILEDDVFCGPSMVFTNVKNPRSAVPRNSSKDYLPTIVKKGASMGANSTIVCGATIGENAFVAAGAVVTNDVAPHALVGGVPAKQIGWMCACGLKLKKQDDRFICPECGRKYSLKDGNQIAAISS
jgi:UDP-2-acetamido-3-amino-2,3-dideoxy-glucuronate N-acetyltransferase